MLHINSHKLMESSQGSWMPPPTNISLRGPLNSGGPKNLKGPVAPITVQFLVPWGPGEGELSNDPRSMTFARFSYLMPNSISTVLVKSIPVCRFQGGFSI